MLIIGIGNPDRGDDAAGILVVRRLRERDIEAIEHTGATLNLMDLWGTSNRVILVDAIFSGGEPGAIRVWDPWEQALERIAFRASTHEFSLADAVELARTMDRLPMWMRIYGIESKNFEAGTRPCEKVIAATERVAEEIEKRLSTVS